VAQINEKLVRQEIIFNAKRIYFSLLKAQKLFDIAKNTVTQLKAHKEVAHNYYQVGMTPLNDFLQADVELANAEQEFIAARNQMENAESDFNNLLRRPLDTPVKIKDIIEYFSFQQDLEYCLAEAEKNRLEIKVAELKVEIAERETDLAQKNYYPDIDLQGSYFKNGTSWDVDGGEGISDPSGWNVLATASWDFWEWGKTAYGIRESKSRLSQARLKKDEILDTIRLQVKNAYLRTKEAEQAILTVEKAIEQAKENFRINQERYKEQIATSTDVLDAQTLLSRTTSNYYNALYEFKISKAALYKAMGQEIIE
jgi:outer membrane protein TolC